MLSTRRQLEIMVVIAISCEFVGIKIGWTWYLLAVYFAALVGFCAIGGLSWLDRKHHETERVRRSPRDFIPEASAPGPTIPEPAENHEAVPASVAVNGTPDAALRQFLVRRVLVEILVSLLIFGVLVLLGWNPLLAAGVTLAGGVIAFLLQLAD